MLTREVLALNFLWIRILSFVGILPVKLNSSAGRIIICKGSKRILFLCYLVVVMALTAYFVWETYWNMQTDPVNTIYGLSIYNLFVVASVAGSWCCFSYFIMWPEACMFIFNDSIIRDKNKDGEKTGGILRGFSVVEFFTIFIPIGHAIGTSFSIIALAIVSWPLKCGAEPLLSCLDPFLEGFTMGIALAWCYFGTLIQILFMLKVSRTLTAETRNSK